MNEQNEIIGKQFGALIPIRISSSPHLGMRFYDCRCLRCNTVINDVDERDIVEFKVRCCNKCNKHDLTGMRFNKLTVFGFHEKTKYNASIWKCQCDCGNIKYIRGDGLISSHIKSCGCFKIENRTIDLTGKKFGRLIVLEKTDKRGSDGGIYWKCQCQKEGNVVIVASNNLIRGNVLSCGCLARERSSETHKHWKTDIELHLSTSVHQDMIQRCHNPNSGNYYNYGARGIRVCDEWRNKETGKDNFVKWALENGYEPGLTLERKNEGEYHALQNGPYAPWNCRWATHKEQANNRRSNIYITIDEVTKTLAGWIDATGINGPFIRKMYANNPEEAIEFIKTKL